MGEKGQRHHSILDGRPRATPLSATRSQPDVVVGWHEESSVWMRVRRAVVVRTPCHSEGVGETSVFERLDRMVDELAKISVEFDAGVVVGAAGGAGGVRGCGYRASAVVLKTLAMRRVDEAGEWRSDGFRSPQKWLAHKTRTSLSDAYGTVELGEQLDGLPAGVRRGTSGHVVAGEAKLSRARRRKTRRVRVCW